MKTKILAIMGIFFLLGSLVIGATFIAKDGTEKETKTIASQYVCGEKKEGMNCVTENVEIGEIVTRDETICSDDGDCQYFRETEPIYGDVETCEPIIVEDCETIPEYEIVVRKREVVLK